VDCNSCRFNWKSFIDYPGQRKTKKGWCAFHNSINQKKKPNTCIIDYVGGHKITDYVYQNQLKMQKAYSKKHKMKISVSDGKVLKNVS